MATKTPLKTAKATVKKSTPAKKTAASKSVKAAAKAPAPKKATPAKVSKAVSTPKSVSKPIDKKATSKASAPAPSKKAAAVAPKKAMPAAKNGAVKVDKPLSKGEVGKKGVAVKPPEAPIIAENSPTPSGKQIVVPSKPAINPRPAKLEKAPEAKPAKPVAIPKTTTDKKVDYEPEFIKSVLDSPVQQTNNPTMRYSDAELQEFRDLINKKLDAAKKELAYLQGLITRKDEMGGDETDNRYMTMEDGSMSMEREQLSQMASRQITFIDHLEKAIMRIENKTYGICRVTGKLIDKARLRAVPHATLSMEAKLGIVK